MDLPRIEKALRDIERSQAEADKNQRALDIAMNVEDKLAVTAMIGATYGNIDGIERTARTSAAIRIDEKTGAAEGLALFTEAGKRCASAPDHDTMKVEGYRSLIDRDCAAYSTVLKERMDSAAGSLIQTQKNQEMFDETERMKRNQLDLAACRTEYQACAKNQCGEAWKECAHTHQINEVINRCEAINKGKCDDSKVLVIRELRKYIEAEHLKNKK